MVRIEWPLHVVRRIVVSVVVAAVLAAGGWFAADRIENAAGRCGEGVVKQGPHGECVGVTDGSYVFAPALDQVEGKIKKENDRVAKEHGDDYVSIAYMTPFTLTATDSNSSESVQHELEGAYAAQYRFNVGDKSGTPKVRLLIANPGSHSAYWKHTVDALVAERDANHLVAVTGLGPSTEENLAAVRRLSTSGLALVASTMTADSISGIRNFVRVTPTNTTEAQAATAYAKAHGFTKAVVVQDAAKSNLYASTLGKAFQDAYPDDTHKLVADPLTYDSSVPTAWENEIGYFPAQLCDEKPQLVYFAGRGIHLTHFLQSLADRRCGDIDFTVMTGDDTTNLTQLDLAAAAQTKIKVLFTGLAHPDMYDKSKDKRVVAHASAAFFARGGQMARWFPHDDRTDGQAMMAHDAVLTAELGSSMAAKGQTPVVGDAVARMFHQMNGYVAVPGASGFLSFDSAGNPRAKAVPVLRLTPAGSSEFVEVSAAGGTPQHGEDTGAG